MSKPYDHERLNQGDSQGSWNEHEVPEMTPRPMAQVMTQSRYLNAVHITVSNLQFRLALL